MPPLVCTRKLRAPKLTASILLAFLILSSRSAIAQQAVMVKDILPGSGGSSPANLTSVNGILYFTADNGSDGRELWRSDGTAEGTFMIMNINPSGDSNPADITLVEGTIFFSADDGATGSEVWKTDGTSLGTELVVDLIAGPDASAPGEFASFGGKLIFEAKLAVAEAPVLCFTDGSAAGTGLIQRVDSAELIILDDFFLFLGDDGSKGQELWRSDGTTSGTQLVVDINPSGDSAPKEMTNVNGTIFFIADDGISGDEIWKSDGTAGGTVLVVDLIAGSDSSTPAELTAFGDVLLFEARLNVAEDPVLCFTSGTPAGTGLIERVDTAELTLVQDGFFFQGDDGVKGKELWFSDGTTNGTKIVVDLNPLGDSSPKSLTALAGTMFFAADDGSQGEELWKSDGTAQGTQLVLDIAAVGGSSPSELIVVDGTLFFTADDGNLGRELWMIKPLSGSQDWQRYD